MKLPNAEHAIIEREKVANYLLNSGHPDNGGKAPYFEASGFHRDAWHVFAEALRASPSRKKSPNRWILRTG